MTTVAASVKHRMIAADSMCSADGYHYLVTKLWQGAESSYGCAGEWAQILKFLQLLEKGGDADSECDVQVLELRKDGLWLYDGHVNPFKLKNEYYAIGTGAPYAIAAMYCGKSPSEAVEIASLFDPATRGPVDIHKIGGEVGKTKDKVRLR